MKWTYEKPTKVGSYYWVRSRGTFSEVVQILIGQKGELRAGRVGNMKFNPIDSWWFKDAQWSGPIEPPEG